MREELGGVNPFRNHPYTALFLLASLNVLFCTPSLRLAKAALSTDDLEMD